MKIWPKKEMQISLKQMMGFSIHYKRLERKKNPKHYKKTLF